MKLWIISGAGRHVGKTYLAMRLQSVLPDAWLAKAGHNPKRPEKPSDYFTDVDSLLTHLGRLAERADDQAVRHAVIESNELSRRGLGDLRIFLSAPPSRTDVRDDASHLASCAQIVIGPEKPPLNAWRALIVPLTQNDSLADAVLDCLSGQHRHLFGQT